MGTLVAKPFHATGFFLHPLKTSENHRFSDVFRGHRNRVLTLNGLMNQVYSKQLCSTHGISGTKLVHKQPSRGVLIKSCSENMQQIYRRTPMTNCVFNKVAKQLYCNHTFA